MVHCPQCGHIGPAFVVFDSDDSEVECGYHFPDVDRCSPELGLHSVPHKGCILR